MLRRNGGEGTDELVVDLLQAEAQRCQAIGAADYAALDAFSRMIWCTCTRPGVAEDKATYLQNSTGGPHRTVERGAARRSGLWRRRCRDGWLRFSPRRPEGPGMEGRVVEASGLQV